MAGRDHDAAVEPFREGREVDALSAAQADVGNVHAGVGQAADQGLAQLGAGQADIPADAHPLRADEGGIGLADLVGQGFVEFSGDAAPDVVGLECGEGGHACSLTRLDSMAAAAASTVSPRISHCAERARNHPANAGQPVNRLLGQSVIHPAPYGEIEHLLARVISRPSPRHPSDVRRRDLH